MNTREWALIIFTTLAQLSVGMLFVLLIVRTYASGKLGSEKAAGLTNLPIYGVAGIMILALVASLFHLGKVVHVVGAVPNLATSWMSREVVCSVTFMVLTALFAIFEWRKIGSEGLRIILAWLAVVVGVVLLISMSMTYMLAAQPAWNTLATPINFFVTALLLGILGSAAALVAATGARAAEAAELDVVKTVVKWAALVAVVLLGIELLVLPIYMAFLSTQGVAAVRSLSLLVTQYGFVLFLRLLLVFIGAGVLAVYLYRDASTAGREKTFATLAYSAFALVLVSELLGRVLFYAARYRIGV
jgi:anaerobic dimethyl sulfoxide reductase subunit C (anchor subunit)